MKSTLEMKKWSSQWTQFMQLRKEAWKKNQDFNGVSPDFFFQASLRNCINCVHCDDHLFISISFQQFIYDLFHISLTLKSTLLFHLSSLFIITPKILSFLTRSIILLPITVGFNEELEMWRELINISLHLAGLSFMLWDMAKIWISEAGNDIEKTYRVPWNNLQGSAISDKFNTEVPVRQEFVRHDCESPWKAYT